MSEDFIEDSADSDENEVVQPEITEAAANNPKLRWYVVQAFSGYEGRVQKTLSISKFKGYKKNLVKY
jgi:hypothetical protein